MTNMLWRMSPFWRFSQTQSTDIWSRFLFLPALKDYKYFHWAASSGDYFRPSMTRWSGISETIDFSWPLESFELIFGQLGHKLDIHMNAFNLDS